MSETIRQFDYEYKLLREAVIKGQMNIQEAKDWIKTRGSVVATIADDERNKMIKRMCELRANLDVPILEEEN